MQRIAQVKNVNHLLFLTVTNYYWVDMILPAFREDLEGYTSPVPQSVKMHDIYKDLDLVCDRICELTDDETVLNKVKKLKQAGRTIAAWSNEYKFADCDANGYLSLLKIGIRLGEVCVKRYQAMKRPRVDEEMNNLLEFASIAVDVMVKLREDSILQENCERPSLQASSLSMFVQLFGLLLRIDNKTIAPAYGTYCGFWLSKWSRFTAVLIVCGLSLLSASFTDGLRCLVDSHYRGHVFADLIKSADVTFVMKLRTFLHSPLYKNLLPFVFYGITPEIRQNIFIPRQYDWILSTTNFKISHSNIDNLSSYIPKKQKIRCKIYQARPKNIKPNKELVIYCHGGGFVTGMPESQEVFIRDWANKLEGIPIISIDYTLSPEAKFPVALQEILDVYLWVTSGSSDVESVIGYHPTSIVLAGDSAGGNMTASLAMILNDIRKSCDSPIIIMPKSLICLYAPFNLTLLLSPSMILAACDSLLSAGVMLSCFEAYIPSFNPLMTKSDDLQVVSSFWNIGNIFNSVIKFIKKLLAPHNPVTPWYRAEEKQLTATVEKLYELTSNPYISPLYYDDFESLSNVSLHLLSLHFDPFLDDSITLANKWKGKVSLEVFDGLQHGFLNFLPVLKDGMVVSNRVVELIKSTFI